MSSTDSTSLPDSVKLPFEAHSHSVTPFFKHMSCPNVAQSETLGKPVFDLKEVVELRLAGDRNYSPVVPVDAMYRNVQGRVITFAERFADQYRQFLMGDTQTMGGTALEALIDYGITPAQLSLCRAMNVHSVEALHAIEGPKVKALGFAANDLKEYARRYMTEKTNKSIESNSAEVERLKAEIAEMKAAYSFVPVPAVEATPTEKEAALKNADDEYSDMSNDELKAMIKEASGSAPKGQPSRTFLVNAMKDLGL